MKHNIKDPVFTKKFLKLSLPMVFQSLMLACVAAADAIMLGSVEQNAMSAVSLATQFQFLQNMILSAFISSISILGSQYWGKEDYDTVNDVLCIGLRASILLSLLFSLSCIFLPRYLMLIFTNEEVLIEIGVRYLQIAGWSYLITGISQCFLAHMKITLHTSQAALISSCVVVINIVLNAVFIFGFFGIPAMGVQGAALATLISRIIELIWTLGLSYSRKYLHPSFRQYFRFRKLLEKDFYRCVMPLLGACIFWSFGFSSYSSFMGHLGTDAAAANSVAAVVRDLVCCLGNGFSGAANIIVGNELGAGKLDTGKTYGIRLMKISFISGFVSTAILLLCTPLLLMVVKLTENAANLLFGMMLITSFYMIGRTVNTIVINGIFASGGDTMFDMYSLAVVMWGIAIPLAVLGTFFLNWHPLIVYACTCLDEVGKIPWVMFHFRKYKWVKDLTRIELS